MKSGAVAGFTSLVLCALGVSMAAETAKSPERRAGDVTTARLLNAATEPGEWLTGGRDYQQSYYSPLADIHRGNVKRLGFAWSYDIASGRTGATPIVVDGVMYTSGNRGTVYALDARTGTEDWTFTPDINPDVLRKHCCGSINRGVAVWRGRVYVAAVDGYLYALDADTGALRWKVDTFADRSRGYSSTGAPYIAKNLVVIGNSGAEFDARGYVTAYDTQTGKLVWRFFTVPGDPKKGFEHPELEMAAKTWDPNSLWELGLGGTVWDGMAYDPKLNLLYVGTGNAIPYPRKVRSPAGGDNLFLACILAINPDTGRLKWYYQTVPGEQWDYTATQKLILADLRIAGKRRKVVMQAPKNGFFYVLDRVTGEMISARAYAKVNWATHVDSQTGRPRETEQSDYSKEPKLIYPGGEFGAHSWQPMAYNPDTGLVYVPVFEKPNVYKISDEPFEYRKDQFNLGMEWQRFPGDAAPGDQASAAVIGADQGFRGRLFLRAWNPAEERVVWEVETTGTSPVTVSDSGGAMATAGGLVLQGRKDGYLWIYDAQKGTELHRIDVGASMAAAPMTFRVGGEQFVAVMAGGHGEQPRIVSFKLGGGAVPKHPQMNRKEFSRAPPAFDAKPQQIELGNKLYERHCSVCHSRANIAPDLTRMDVKTHTEFKAIVLKGIRTDKGMGNFSAVLTESAAESIHAYVTDLAWKTYRRQLGGVPAPAPEDSAAQCAEPRKSDRPVKLLIVTGGHPYEPSEFFATFANMSDVRFDHYYLVGSQQFSVPLGGLGRYDVILFYDMQQGEITPEWRSLLNHGGSFVFLHHAIGSFPQSREFTAIAGGHANFSQIPIAGVSNTTVHFNQRQRFTLVNPRHAVTCGLGDFDMLDEAYDHVDALPGVQVLMRSNFPKASPAVGWTWNYQGKRVVYLQPGHGRLGLPADSGPSSYQNEPFKSILWRAIQWAAGRL